MKLIVHNTESQQQEFDFQSYAIYMIYGTFMHLLQLLVLNKYYSGLWTTSCDDYTLLLIIKAPH